MDAENKILELQQEVIFLKEELRKTKEHLKKYTAPASGRRYYEKNKEVLREKNKKYKEETNYKPSPEAKKEYNKQAYLRRKEKLQKDKDGII
jgi:hypothetical protein